MASPNISFEKIPSSTRKPGHYFEFNTKLAKRSLPTNEQNILLIGTSVENAKHPNNVPIDVFSDKEAADLFGAGSLAHRMVAAAITANPYAKLTVVTAGFKYEPSYAVWELSLSGATDNGSLVLEIGAERVVVALEKGMTVDDEVLYGVLWAVTNNPDLPVRAEVDASKEASLKLIAKCPGRESGRLKISVSVMQQDYGLTATLANTDTGHGEYDVESVFAAVFGGWYHIYVSPSSDFQLCLSLRSQLEALGHPFEQRDAIGVVGTSQTLSNASVLAGIMNSGFMTLAWHNKSRVSDAEIAAGYAAVIASEEDPARPLNTLEIKGLDVTPIEDQPGRKEQENALHNGVTPLEVGPGNRVQIVRAVTNYQYNDSAGSIPDDTLLDLTTIRTLQYLRKACRERIALRFPREKISNRIPAKVRSELLDVLRKCEELEFVRDIDEYAPRLIVERDSQNYAQLNSAIPSPVVPGLHIFAGRIDLYL